MPRRTSASLGLVEFEEEVRAPLDLVNFKKEKRTPLSCMEFKEEDAHPSLGKANNEMHLRAHSTQSIHKNIVVIAANAQTLRAARPTMRGPRGRGQQG